MYALLQPLLLASASPRRLELLAGCGLVLPTNPANIIEQHLSSESALQMARRLATAKAIAGAQPGFWTLAADTDVVQRNASGEQVFGKPKGLAEAVAMLERLSGSQHQVIGAIALVDPQGKLCGVEESITEVAFRSLSEEEIRRYCEGPEPYDKAGAYAAQGFGASFVSSIKGSYSNVVGLDLALTLKLLLQWQVIGVAAHE